MNEGKSNMELIFLSLLSLAGGMVFSKARDFWYWIERKLVFSLTLVGEPCFAVLEALNSEQSDNMLEMGFVNNTILPNSSASDETKLRLGSGPRIMRICGKKTLVWVWTENLQAQIIYRVRFTCNKKYKKSIIGYVTEKYEQYVNKLNEGLPVYSPMDGSYWGLTCIRPFRDIKSIKHSHNEPIKILEYIKDWQTKEEEYEGKGENYNLSLLFHGVPGTGKTSCAIALASELKMPLYVITPTNKERVEHLISTTKNNCIILFEECDAIFDSKDELARVSSLLSTLDGPVSKKGVIRIYTTNDKAKIDKRFFRIGRIDKEIEFDVCLAPNSENIDEENRTD